jgi:hypothetical protein
LGSCIVVLRIELSASVVA